MTSNVTAVPVRALALAWEALARQQANTGGRAGECRLKVFLDCDRSLEAWMRAEIDFVTFVGDRRDADVCVHVTPVPAHGQARHYRVRFVDAGRFELIEASARFHPPGVRTTRCSSSECPIDEAAQLEAAAVRRSALSAIQ